MTEFPETRDSLLVQVRSSRDSEAWNQFVQIYRPVIYRLARARGLQDADAQDLAQRVLLSVSSAIGSWEKSQEKVQFRHWLRRVVRNAIINMLSRQPSDQAVGGTTEQSLLNHLPIAASQSDAEIELEYRREIYRRASQQVRLVVEPATWRAFEITVIDGKSIEEAAAILNKPIGAIYVARSRVMRRLRESILEMERSDT